MSNKEYDLNIFDNTVQDYYSTEISFILKKKLEIAYEYFTANIDTPYIITKIEYKDVNQIIFLIAKNPKKNVYHGIIYLHKKRRNS